MSSKELELRSLYSRINERRINSNRFLDEKDNYRFAKKHEKIRIYELLDNELNISTGDIERYENIIYGTRG